MNTEALDALEHAGHSMIGIIGASAETGQTVEAILRNAFDVWLAQEAQALTALQPREFLDLVEAKCGGAEWVFPNIKRG